MHRMLVLYPPPADPAAFRAYYETTHLPLAAKLPGLRRSEYGFGMAGLGAPSPYFCIWQGDFDNEAAMQHALTTPEGKAAAADMSNYATGGAIVLHVAVES